jgi:predicted HicB family RNase H-like nuclease
MAKSRRRREVVAGIEMTEENVDRLVEETIKSALRDDAVWYYPQRGRPSLSGKPATSPHVGFRVSPELREQADALARRRGITLSQPAREALEQYVKGA